MHMSTQRDKVHDAFFLLVNDDDKENMWWDHLSSNRPCDQSQSYFVIGMPQV